MNAPKKIGNLELVAEKYNTYTYEGDGKRYVVTGLQLALWGNKVTEMTIKVHAQKRLTLDVDAK